MSITTKQCNITIECGADFYMHFVVRDDEDALVDLTGATVSAQLREYEGAIDYFDFTATNNGAGGKVTLTMPFEDTAQIGYTRGYYDVFVTFPDSSVEKYMMGDVTIEPNVTKPIAGTVMYLLSFGSEDDFPIQGLLKRLYLSHATNKMYRWNGTNYVSIVRNGDAATVEVGTVTTLAPDQNAYVTNVGSLENAVFDFGIPQGEKGDTGTSEWGVITGNISDQTDLQNALDAKADSADLGALAVKDTADFYDDISNKPAGYPPSPHDHDDRYYTEGEVDTLLAGKSDTGHTHTVSDVTDFPSLGTLASKNTVDWDTDIDDIPLTFPPESHTHDDRYYTEAETDALLADKADIILVSASGSVVSIADGAPLPVSALSVSVDAVQDLHGQDAPYPAGGGKNKFTSENEHSGQYLDTNGEVRADSGWVYSDYIAVEENTEYYFQPNSTAGNSAKTWYYDSSKNQISYIDSGAGSFTTPNGCAYMRFSYRSTSTDVQLELGSSATSYAPYSNVCPISGWTEATVTRTGTNIWDEVWEIGNIDADTGEDIPATGRICSTNYTSIKPNTTYYCVKGGGGQIVPRYYDLNKTYIGMGDGTAIHNTTFTTPNNAYFMRFVTTTGYGGNYGHDISINYPPTDTQYHAYITPVVLTIDLGGTRYGGVLNVLTGELTVTHAIVDLGTLEWERGEGTGGVYVFQAVVSDKAKGVTNMICSDYATTTVTAWNSNKPNNSICGSATNLRFVIRDTRYSTAPAFTTAVSGVKAVYELADYVTVQLTANQLSTLLGDNVLWADCGATSLTYRAGTELYVERRLDERTTATQEMLTTVTGSMVAPKNLTAGDLCIVNDTLYRATANIASGSAMTVGTNVVATTIEEVTAPLYGVCDSANSTTAKTVTIPNFILRTGVTIVVKFENNNSQNNPTLNVNGTGDYPIYRYGTTNAGSTNATTGWQTGSVLSLTFDGAGWIVHLWQNTTYTLYGAYCTTSASTAAKVASCTYFALRECWFELTLRYANTKNAALTLNVASTGALPIYINGSASSSSNYTLPGGQYIVYCDGTKYYFRTDGKIEGLCEEAPKDGNAYVRKNGAWVNINSL